MSFRVQIPYEGTSVNLDLVSLFSVSRGDASASFFKLPSNSYPTEFWNDFIDFLGLFVTYVSIDNGFF